MITAPPAAAASCHVPQNLSPCVMPRAEKVSADVKAMTEEELLGLTVGAFSTPHAAWLVALLPPNLPPWTTDHRHRQRG